MQVVSSYGAEIKNKNIPIRHTLALYREAVRCLTEIYETVWTELSMIDQIKRRLCAQTRASSLTGGMPVW